MSGIIVDNNLRLARMESFYNLQRENMLDVMQKAYDKAVEEKNETEAAELARKIRNKLLSDTDSEMTIDRLDIDVTSVTTLITSLTNVLSNKWREYRQHLRDIPEQSGFPFDIDWGEKPED